MLYERGRYRRSDGRAVTALAGLALAALLAITPAAAHGRHHRVIHAAQPAPAADPALGPTAPGISAILIDAATGAVLSATGADIPRYPASLTKLMVLDLTFQALRENRISLETPVPVSFHAASVQPVKLGLRPGDSLTVEQAILSMTTMSANDAATALGEFLGGGSESRCAQIMTLRAQALGMAQTQFENASGLPNPSQVTTARDLAILSRDIVVSFPEFQSFFEQTQFDLNGRTIYSNNQMLKIYPGATGLKTGYTTLAKHNLITSADRGGRILIGVVLHEPSWPSTYNQMTAMLDLGYGVPTPADLTFLSTQRVQPAFIPTPPAKFATTAPQTPPYTPQPTKPVTLALNTAAARATLANWTDQIGAFSKLEKARRQAIEAAHIALTGIPRVARVERHGRTLYAAQLAGLTQTAAHETCWALAARRTACTVIPPQADHLADLENFNG